MNYLVWVMLCLICVGVVSSYDGHIKPAKISMSEYKNGSYVGKEVTKNAVVKESIWMSPGFIWIVVLAIFLLIAGIALIREMRS